ncbi:MAG: sugar ABC transporter permease [Nitrososphaerota archaeon]|nr:sugar ABC transporter permease [Nitrososphaerota archaeon]
MTKESIVRRIRGSPFLFILPALIALILIILYPFAFNIFISFTNMNVYHIRNYTLVNPFWRNYSFVFTDPVFDQVVENTFIWTFANVIPTVAIGLVLAFVLNTKIKGKTIYRLFMIVPWAMPSFITLLIWRGMYNYQYGIVNALLAQLGISSVNWLHGNCATAMFAIVLANIWLGYPFMMVIFSGALQSIPNELYEVASIDGAVGFNRFRYIVVPMIRPTILIALLLGSIWTFNNFNSAFLITQGGPGTCTSIFITQAYNQAFTSTFPNYAVAAAYAFIAFIVLLVPGLFWTKASGLTRRTA